MTLKLKKGGGEGVDEKASSVSKMCEIEA